MGRTDTRLDYQPHKCPHFYDHLMTIMSQKDKSRYRIVKETQLSNGYFYRWKKGSDPLVETLIPLAEYLDCTLDYLIGRDR